LHALPARVAQAHRFARGVQGTLLAWGGAALGPDEELVASVSATSGLWSSVVIAGAALLFLGVMLALSASLPSGAEDERTEWGLIASCVGATLTLLGTSKELLPHIGWIGLVLDGVILFGVTCGVFCIVKNTIVSRWRACRFAPRVEAFLRAASHPKVSVSDGPKDADKHA
jgi:hypothetical protein